MNFPDIKTPKLVKIYAPAWAGGKKKQVDRILDKVFEKFSRYPSVATFVAKDSRVGFVSVRAVSPPTIPYKRNIIRVACGRNPSLEQFRKVDPTGYFIVPHGKTHYLSIAPEIPLVVFKEMEHDQDVIFLMPEDIRDEIRTKISQGKDILIDVHERTSDIKSSHATILFYSVSENMVYYLNPWGSKTPKDYEVSEIHIRKMFLVLFGQKIRGMFHSWDICPYGVQNVERFKEHKGIIGLCKLWSLMLMTKHLEYSSRGVSMTAMVANLFQTHPFLVLDRWLLDLGLAMTPVKVNQNSIVNPLTGARILKTGKLYKDLVRQRVIKSSPLKRPVKTPVKNCTNGTILNPETNRCVSKTGKVYKDLVKRKVVQENVAPAPERAEKPCKDGTVRNPKTKRCVTKTGKLYRDLVRNGAIRS